MLTNIDVEIFPNPTDDFFIITGDLGLFDIEIINSSGQVVQIIDISNTQEIIDTSTLSPGLHLIRVEHKTNNTIFVQKIIKM